jgi:hypothetical protein
MPVTRVWDITCAECGEVNTVGEQYWPATRWDPPDGQLEREECDSCGADLHEGDWSEAEPPDPY